MRWPSGRRPGIWPLAAAGALIVAAAGWIPPLIAPPAPPPAAAFAGAPPPEPRRAAGEQLADFLLAWLAEPDPAGSGGGAMMSAWLDRVARAQESRFAPSPDLRASLHAALGRAYAELGSHRQAVTHFRALLALRHARLGGAHRETLEAMALIGCALLEEGARLQEAEQLLSDAARERHAALGAEDPDTLMSRVQGARLQAKRGRFEEAEREYEEVLGIMQRVLGPDHPATLEGAERYALFLAGLNRPAEAAPRLEDLYRRYTQRHGAGHPRTVATLNALATVHARRGDDPKAEAAFRDLLAVYVEEYGDEHQKTLFTRINLAIVLEKRGDLAAAEAQFRAAVEAHRRCGALEPPVLVTAATRWARVLARRGRAAEAAAEFEQIDTLVTRLYGPDDRRLHGFRAERGALLTGLGRYPEAERILLENYRWYERSPEAAAVRHDDYLAPLARLYETWGKDREAKRIRNELEKNRSAAR